MRIEKPWKRGGRSAIDKAISPIDRALSEIHAAETYSAALTGGLWGAAMAGGLTALVAPAAAPIAAAKGFYSGMIKGGASDIIGRNKEEMGLTGKWAKGGELFGEAVGYLDARNVIGAIAGNPLTKSPVGKLVGAISGDSLGDLLDARESEGFRDAAEDIGGAKGFAEAFKNKGTESDMFGTSFRDKSLSAITANAFGKSADDVFGGMDTTLGSPQVGYSPQADFFSKDMDFGIDFDALLPDTAYPGSLEPDRGSRPLTDNTFFTKSDQGMFDSMPGDAWGGFADGISKGIDNFAQGIGNLFGSDDDNKGSNKQSGGGGYGGVRI